LTCHNCRIYCQKAGKHRNGLQRFRCNTCGKTYTEPHEQETAAETRLEDQNTLLALRMICEGSSVRAASRITGIHHRLIILSLMAAGERYERLLSERIQNVPVQDVQCDEILGFVQKKKRNRHGDEENLAHIGDAWIFVAIERHTNLVLTYDPGKRTVSAASRFMGKLVTATDAEKRFQLTTDGRLRQPGTGLYQHIPHRTPEPPNAYVHAAADPADERILEEMGQPESGVGPALCLLQLRSRPPVAQGKDARDGVRTDGSRVHGGRITRSAKHLV
jgi:transposase-like protein